MKGEHILYLGVGMALGWYLALNKRKETERALALAKAEAQQLASDLQLAVNDTIDSIEESQEQEDSEDMSNENLGL